MMSVDIWTMYHLKMMNNWRRIDKCRVKCATLTNIDPLVLDENKDLNHSVRHTFLNNLKWMNDFFHKTATKQYTSRKLNTFDVSISFNLTYLNQLFI